MSTLRSSSEHSTRAGDGAGSPSSLHVGAPVLLVEDDADTRSVVRGLLEDEGYRVLEAKNGREALDLLVSRDTNEPFLVILDLGLPLVSGSELVEIMRSYRRLSTIPVLVVSGSRLDLERDPSAGAVSYLRKPFDVAELLAIVGKHAPRATTIEPSPDDFTRPSGVKTIDPGSDDEEPGVA